MERNEFSEMCIRDSSEIIEIENAVDRTSYIGKRDYAILLLASRLGMRAGDIASLKLDSLDFKNQRICLSLKASSRDITPWTRWRGLPSASWWCRSSAVLADVYKRQH